jgi:hypothetical protein
VSGGALGRRTWPPGPAQDGTVRLTPCPPARKKRVPPPLPPEPDSPALVLHCARRDAMATATALANAPGQHRSLSVHGARVNEAAALALAHFRVDTGQSHPGPALRHGECIGRSEGSRERTRRAPVLEHSRNSGERSHDGSIPRASGSARDCPAPEVKEEARALFACRGTRSETDSPGLVRTQGKQRLARALPAQSARPHTAHRTPHTAHRTPGRDHQAKSTARRLRESG